MRIYGDIAAWFTDAETERFVEASTKALQLFGYTRDEFLRLSPSDIVIPEEHSQLDERLDQAKKRWGLGQWWTCRNKDGFTFRMQCRYHMQEFDGRMCFFMMVVNTGRNAPIAYGCPEDGEWRDESRVAAAR